MRGVVWLLACPFSICTLLPAQARPSAAMAQAAAAYAAKVTASAICVSGRTLESVLAQELAPTRPLEALIRPLLRFDIDREAGTVTCRLGQQEAIAVHRQPGCALVADGMTIEEVRANGAVRPPSSDTWPRTRAAADVVAGAPQHWPAGEAVAATVTTGIDTAALQRALEAAFAETDDRRPVNTRAVVIVHKGQLVAERYAPGFTAQMPLPGWSMTKTLTNALIGMRVLDGAMDLDTPPDVPEWRRADDARARIGVRDLLSMSAGLEWNEDYDDANSDALRMLFGSADHAGVYASRPAGAAPGERFQYASGATNLLCRLLRRTFEDDVEYRQYPGRLFRQLGMRTALLEIDPSGTFVGSSYGFASARDWARLGLLFVQDGVFDGRRVLPTGWVRASTTPHPASDGGYGYQIWLNADPDGDGPRQRRWSQLPADLFHMDGHEGQHCVVSPTAELVVVRLGCSKNGGFDLPGLLRAVHAALPE